MATERAETKAMKYVMDFERKCGRIPKDVSKDKKHFKGFDIISFSKDKEKIRTIEVKGTTKLNSIPDCYETNFTRTNRLVADYLYVVAFNGEKPVLYIVPSEDIKPEHLKEKIMLRFTSTFKTKILPKHRINKEDL